MPLVVLEAIQVVLVVCNLGEDNKSSLSLLDVFIEGYTK